METKNTTLAVEQEDKALAVEQEDKALAVEQEDKALAVEQTTTDIIVEPPKATLAITPRLEGMIAETARAQCVEEKSTAICALEKAGLLSPASHLHQIINRCGDRLFAGVYVDDKGNRYIHVRQQYSSGKYSPEFCISQDDLLNVYADRGEENSTDDEKREARASMKKIRREYFRKIDSNDLIKVENIVDAIAEVLPMLPEENQEQELSQYELFMEVIDALRKIRTGGGVLNGLRDEKRGYLKLDDYMLDGISREMKFSRKELLAQLKKNNLLYLTGSCRGYQTKVPCGKDKDGRIEYGWAYCVYDLEFLGQYKDGDRPEPAYGEEIEL